MEVKKESPLLSLCIPTYNRSEYLERTLISILSQQGVDWNEIEIVISDNNSSDNTEGVSSNYSSHYPFIKYFRNEENVNDRNFPLSLYRATGCFRKLHNDTLELYAGGLARIVKTIKENYEKKPVIFFLNDKRHREKKNFHSLEDFLYYGSFFITWIGGFGIWEEDFSQIKNLFEGCETQLWQEQILLKTISQKGHSVIDRQKFGAIQTVKNKNMSYGLYKVFYENYLSLIIRYSENGTVSNKCLEWLKKDLLFRFFANHLINFELSSLPIDYNGSAYAIVKSIQDQYITKSYYTRFRLYLKAKKTARVVKGIIKKMIY